MPDRLKLSIEIILYVRLNVLYTLKATLCRLQLNLMNE